MLQLTRNSHAATVLCISVLAASLASADTFEAVDYGAADANEQSALDAINGFRADPQNELYKIFQGQGYGGSKSTFDALLSGQTSYSENFWLTNFGNNIITGSMDHFETVPSSIQAQFNSLPTAGSLSSYQWSNNIGWSAHQYADWIEADGGATSNPHAIPGAPTLGDRFTNAGVNWTAVGENIARGWPLDPVQMHAGFAIDWGTGIDGIQNPPGHRNSMLSPDFSYIATAIVDNGGVLDDYTQVQHLANQFSTDPIFYGYVFDEQTRDVLSGATVSLFDTANQLLGTTTTDARGAYTIQFDTGFGTPDRAEFAALGRIASSSALGSSASNYFLDASITAIPEPSSLLALTALFAPAVLRRRNRT